MPANVRTTSLPQPPVVPMFMLGRRELPIEPSEVSLFGYYLTTIRYTALAREFGVDCSYVYKLM